MDRPSPSPPPRRALHRALRLALPALLLAGAASAATAPRYELIETPDLRLCYYKATMDFISPYTTQCFENSVNFYRRVLGYKPTQRVNVFLDDYADFMNAGVWCTPRNSMSMHIAPASFIYETGQGSERISFTMNHEVAHVVTLDVQSGADGLWRGLFAGHVRETNDDPVTILYGYLTLPRRAAPRWHREGTAVFFETWMSGGFGRAQGPYDEMVFRSMVLDSAYFYDPLGLESEGTKADFQVGVNAYLYGTRFTSYVVREYGPTKFLEWISRNPGSKAYFASQFRHVYGLPLEEAWQNWIKFEHQFQRVQLDSIARFPSTPYRDLSPTALGSLSRAYYDSTSNVLYAGLDYPGVVAYIGEIPMNGAPIRNLHDVKGATLYQVCSLAWDPDRRKLFYTTDNNDFRDLVELDPATRKATVLIRDGRFGDLVFNRQDRSLWGVRNFNGISSLVRVTAPYRDYARVVSFPYSHDVYDIDISPDGTLLSASMTEVSGHQTLRLFKLSSLMQGDTASRRLYDFGSAIPQSFVFTPDGKALVGSSYYTGVSNIFRYDLAADSMDVLTNAVTGFFRPMPMAADSMIVFRFTGRGFVPSVIHGRPLSDVSAISFLGNELVQKYPELKKWAVPSPATVKLDSVVKYRGPYSSWSRVSLASAYPIVEGYKSTTAVGYKFAFSDPYSFQNLDVGVLASPDRNVPADERWHALAEYRHFNWDAKFQYNGTSFYDLVGPTRVSRKGYHGSLSYDRLLIRDNPRTLVLTTRVSGYANIERLPYFQNVTTPAGFDKGLTPEFDLHYKFIRSSLGWVDPEKGIDWHLRGQVNTIRVDQAGASAWRGFAQGAGTLDLGVPLPMGHSSVWLRTAAGYAPGDRAQPFANFYFGGFGNNYVDYGEPKRYRDMTSFPGVAIDDIGGTNFGRAMLDWNLPPLRFRHLGVLDFYATWARLSLFSTGLVTNMDLPSQRRELVNAGAQADVRLALMIQQPLTFSIGYASAMEKWRRARHEFMISLKILG